MLTGNYTDPGLLCPVSMDIHNRGKERNVLFNDALNMFYLWLYGHGKIPLRKRDRKHTHRIAHTIDFVVPAVAYSLE